MSRFDPYDEDLPPWRQDWTDSFDDTDGADWTEYIDSSAANPEYSPESSLAYDAILTDGVSLGGRRATIEREEATKRRQDIVRWLATSTLFAKQPIPDGFEIRHGHVGVLRDGSHVDMKEWLVSEGIGVKEGQIILGYQVEKWAEDLKFRFIGMRSRE